MLGTFLIAAFSFSSFLSADSPVSAVDKLTTLYSVVRLATVSCLVCSPSTNGLINTQFLGLIASEGSYLNGFLNQNIPDTSTNGAVAGIDLFRGFIRSICDSVHQVGTACSSCVVSKGIAIAPPIDSFSSPYADLFNGCGTGSTPTESQVSNLYYGVTADVKTYLTSHTGILFI